MALPARLPGPTLPESVTCPKLPRVMPGYRYYAGFSTQFVKDVLTLWPDGASVLDPWNGSGTTTRVAADLDLRCVGIDLNPAMVVIARSALLDLTDVQAIRGQAARLQSLGVQRAEIAVSDPLLEWFDRPSVRKVRGLQRILVGATAPTNEAIESMPPRTAFWLVCLFHAVRRRMTSWHSSNPTWIKSGTRSNAEAISWPSLVSDVLTAAQDPSPTRRPETVRTHLGSSSRLETYRATADLVLGSPPYLTRIDYAVATRAELSVLGMPRAAQDDLRRTLLGATTVPTEQPTLPPTSRTAQTALARVRNHASKASKTYYAKWLAQYLHEYNVSIGEVMSAAKADGTIALVVQDSYYKEVHLDLPRITVEILAHDGWHLHRAYDFAPRRSMAQINPRAIAYRLGAVPHEQALFFRRTPKRG